MAAVQEVHSFVNKFLNLCISGKKANLSLNCENKKVAIDLQLDLDLTSCLSDPLLCVPPYPPPPPRQPCSRTSPSRMRRCERRRNRAKTETKENVAVIIAKEAEVTEKVAAQTINTVAEQVAPVMTRVMTEEHAENYHNLKDHQVSAEEAVCSVDQPESSKPPEQEKERAELVDEKDIAKNKNQLPLDSVSTNDFIQLGNTISAHPQLILICNYCDKGFESEEILREHTSIEHRSGRIRFREEYSCSQR